MYRANPYWVGSSSPRGAGDGGGAPELPCWAAVALQPCRRCVGQGRAGRRRCGLRHRCPAAWGCKGWLFSGESLTSRRLWMSLSSLGGHRGAHQPFSTLCVKSLGEDQDSAQQNWTTTSILRRFPS
jgi:hypothetical protein